MLIQYSDDKKSWELRPREQKISLFKEVRDLLGPSVQSVVTMAKNEITSPAKPSEDMKKKKKSCRSTGGQGNQTASPQPERSALSPQQRLSNKTSPVSRRLILQGLLGMGGLAGFGFVGLLLKNLFEPQSTSKPVVQGNAAFALETIQFTTVKLNNQGKVIARPKGTAQTYKEDLGNGLSLTMVKIPAGSFMMGSPSSEEQSENEEKPQYKVNLKAFYLGQTEVTQSQYQVIMGGNPSSFKGAELPAEQVSWLDAKEFCKRLSQKTGKIYGLPSESQWEYACRAGTTTPFVFGDTITTDTANYDGNYIYGKVAKGVHRKKTTVVNTFPPNAFGLFDMHGNVWEWCEDIWHDNYQGAPADGSPWGSENDSFRLLRGGSWDDRPNYCRSALRYRSSAVYRHITFGFRVVCAQKF